MISPVEQSGSAVIESLGVTDGLVHSFRDIETFDALHLDMNAGETVQVRDRAIRQGPAPLDIISAFPEYSHQLTLSGGALAL